MREGTAVYVKSFLSKEIGLILSWSESEVEVKINDSVLKVRPFDILGKVEDLQVIEEHFSKTESESNIKAIKLRSLDDTTQRVVSEFLRYERDHISCCGLEEFEVIEEYLDSLGVKTYSYLDTPDDPVIERAS